MFRYLTVINFTQNVFLTIPPLATYITLTVTFPRRCLQIHSLLAPLLTKVVARRVSARQHDDHWILRKEAAATLVEICNL
jgi:hypothetical protein